MTKSIEYRKYHVSGAYIYCEEKFNSEDGMFWSSFGFLQEDCNDLIFKNNTKSEEEVAKIFVIKQVLTK